MSKTLRELPLAAASVTGDLFHISGSDLLDKRITIDDIAVAVRQTLKGALIANGDVTIQTGGLLKARSNEDVIQEIGRVKVWGFSDTAYVSHFDQATTSAYALSQTAIGVVRLNAPTAQSVQICISNAVISSFTVAAITLSKPTIINNSLLINRTTGAGNALQVTHSVDDWACMQMSSSSAVGKNYGLNIIAGSDAIDYNMRLQDASSNNLMYVRAASVTIYKPTTITGTTGTLLSVGASQLIAADVGKTKIFADAGYNYIANINQGTSANYLAAQADGGTSYINSPLGTSVYIINNNSNVIAQYAATAITFEKSVFLRNLTGNNAIVQSASSSWATATDGGFLQMYNGVDAVTERIRITSANTASWFNGGNLLVGSTTDNGDALQVKANTNASVSLGRSKLYSYTGDVMTLAQYSAANATDWILTHQSNGRSLINAAVGQSIQLYNGAATLLATFSATAITLEKPVTISTGGLKTDNVFTKTKVLEIGDWNMVTTTSVNVTHGITSAKLRSISAIIISDGGVVYDLITDQTFTGVDGALLVGTSVLTLKRRAGGTFDSSGFDLTSYNRGWVTIVYEA